MVDCFFFFFFQAEDGIRDLVRSRGLGDVYKRQMPGPSLTVREALRTRDFWLIWLTWATVGAAPIATVSYTHLTLPTIYSV